MQIVNKARHDGELGAVYITGTYATHLHSDATSMGQKGQDLQEELFLSIRLMVGCLNLKLLGTSIPWPLLIPPAVSCTVLIIPPLDFYIQLGVPSTHIVQSLYTYVPDYWHNNIIVTCPHIY